MQLMSLKRLFDLYFKGKRIIYMDVKEKPAKIGKQRGRSSTHNHESQAVFSDEESATMSENDHMKPEDEQVALLPNESAPTGRGKGTFSVFLTTVLKNNRSEIL